MKRTLQEISDMFGIYIVKNKFPDEHNQYKWFFKKPNINIEGGFWESERGKGYPWYGSTFDSELVKPFLGDWKDSLHSPHVICPKCDGDGKGGVMRRICPKCNGDGNWYGANGYVGTCPTCDGTGRSAEHDREYPPNHYLCPDCGGDGYIGSISSASYPAVDRVNTGTSAITYLKKECPTCNGTGWVER